MSTPTVTAEEYLSAYATRSGMLPRQLLEYGRVVAACTCDYDGCEGWQVIPPDCLQPGAKISLTAEDYANPEPQRTTDQPRCGHCGRYVRWSMGAGWWECSNGCMVPTMRAEAP